MKFLSSLIAVSDIERSKAFYKNVLGLEVEADFGANVTLTGGLNLQTLETWREFIGGLDVNFGGNDAELYFEDKDFDGFVKKLEALGDTRYVHPPTQHSWGQRAVRFYDPDGHIIEVGENISAVPIDDFLKVENIVTGETVSVEDAVSSFPDTEMPKVGFQSEVDEYIAKQPDNLQILLLNVRQTIRHALPDATEKISWSMPTFWQGRNLIHFAAQKNHLGIYPGAEAMKYFAPRLTDYKTSKGAIQFPYKTFGAEQLELIAEIATWCGKENGAV